MVGAAAMTGRGRDAVGSDTFECVGWPDGSCRRSTDEWGTAKHEIARLIGCGSQERERLAERQLDQTREPLQAAPGQELEEARAGLEAVWGVRLRHLLEEHPEKAGELQVLVDQIQAKLPAQDWSKRTQWRDALQPIPRILGWYKDNAVAGILLAAGFVVLKGYVVARGDVATALGILQYAGLATVVTAGLLSSLPILAAAMLAYTLSRVLARVLTRSKEQPPTFSRPLLWVTLGAFALAACSLRGLTWCSLAQSAWRWHCVRVGGLPGLALGWSGCCSRSSRWRP
jgi:hypothetical protein